VLDFDLYENLIRNVLTNEMRFNFQEFSFLLAEDNLHNRVQRERIAQIFYETFDVKNLFFSKNAVLSCFATGRSTALVLDSGATLSEATTVHDGYALGKSNKRCNFGGEALTNELGRYIEEELNVQLGLRNGRASYAAYHRQQLLRTIKEAVYKTEENSQPNELGQPQTTVDFELPDRQTIKIDKSRLPDPFFSSYGQDIAYRGLHHLLNDNINLCDIDIKKELYNNVIVTGGNSLLGGFVPRLQQKLAEVVTPQKCKLISFPFPIERRFSAWIGGSILASLSSFQGFWVGKQEWTEFGPSILEKKCA
jgi:actin-like protein 6A